MSSTIKQFVRVINYPQISLFQMLIDSKKITDRFPGMRIIEKEDQINTIKFEPHEFDYFFMITKTIHGEIVEGNIIPAWDPKLDKLGIRFTLDSNENVKNWTRIKIEYIEPKLQKGSKWWLIVPPLGTLSIIKLLETGFLDLQKAYASPGNIPNESFFGSNNIATTLSSKKIVVPLLTTIIAIGLIGFPIIDTGTFPDKLQDNIISSSDSDLSSTSATSNTSGDPGNSSSESTSTTPSRDSSTTTHPASHGGGDNGGGSKTGGGTSSSNTSPANSNPTSNPSTIASSLAISSINGNNLSFPLSIITGSLYVVFQNVDSSTNEIIKINSVTNLDDVVFHINSDTIQDFRNDFGLFSSSQVKYIALDDNGIFYASFDFDPIILTFDNANGDFISEISLPTSEATSFDVDRAGDTIYAITDSNSAIQKINADTGDLILREFASDVIPFDPNVSNFVLSDIVFDDDSDILYATDEQNNKIYKFDSELNYITTFDADSNLLNLPQGITLDNFGNVFVADSGNDRILKFDSHGNLLESIESFVNSSNQPDTFDFPEFVAVDSQDNIYITDTNNNRIIFLEMENYLCNSVNSPDFEYPLIDDDTIQSSTSEDLVIQANNLAEKKRFKEAFLFYRMAITLDDSNQHGWVGIGNIQALKCVDPNKTSNPIPFGFTQALKTNPQNSNALNGIANFYVQQVIISSDIPDFNSPDALISKAKSYYAQAIMANPADTNALNGIAILEMMLGNYAAAETFFQESLAIEKKTSTINGLALVSYYQNNHANAIDYYQDTLDIDPDNFDALSGLVSIYNHLNQPQNAAPHLVTLQQFTQTSIIVDSLIESGDWLLSQQQYTEAIRLYDAALDLDADNVLALEGKESAKQGNM